MSQDVSLKVVLLVIVIFGGLLACKFWADGRWKSIQGPTHLHVHTNGDLYVAAEPYLFRYGRDGDFIKRYDLRELGIRKLTGDFAIFANGDILLSLHNYAPDLQQRLNIMGRISNRSALTSEKPDSGLFRCNLENGTCAKFGQTRYSLNRTFHLFLDDVSGEVYLSDTSRHVIRKLDSDGNEVAVVNSGFRIKSLLLIIISTLQIPITMCSSS